MVELKTQIVCYTCKQLVDKDKAFLVQVTDKEDRFECPLCYKRKRSQKRELFCGRCKYKFNSKTPVCPYCSKSDEVIDGKVTLKDLFQEDYVG
jgi:RNA polymerase subunit RPABC4/transcription elongation factor Spt4